MIQNAARARKRKTKLVARDVAPSWCAGHESCLELKGPGPLCRVHAMLFAPLGATTPSEAFPLLVAGRMPPRRYQIVRVGPGGLAYLRDVHGDQQCVHVRLLRFAEAGA